MTSTMSRRSRFERMPAASRGRQPMPKRSAFISQPPQPPQPPPQPPPPQELPHDERLQELLPHDEPHPDEPDSACFLARGKSTCVKAKFEAAKAPTPNTAANIIGSIVAPPVCKKRARSLKLE